MSDLVGLLRLNFTGKLSTVLNLSGRQEEEDVKQEKPRSHHPPPIYFTSYVSATKEKAS